MITIMIIMIMMIIIIILCSDHSNNATVRRPERRLPGTRRASAQGGLPV